MLPQNNTNPWLERRVAVHRSGSLDSGAFGASSVTAATDTAKLRLLCAWCGKTMREAEPGSENGSVSHGICDSCAERERAGDSDEGDRGSDLIAISVPG